MAYRTTAKMAERKEVRRRTLLEAAAHLFGRRGYHATTVPAIVAGANSSTGSFYAYFRNKEDVFAAVLEELGERVAAAMSPGEESDPLRRIEHAVEALFNFLARNPEDARILIVESSGLSPELEKVRRKILSRHAEVVQQMIESQPSAFAETIPPIAARCLVGAVFESLCSWLEAGADRWKRAEQVAREVAAYNVRALRARDESLSGPRFRVPPGEQERSRAGVANQK
jgi:AcrR family transcriptional regulator